MSQTTTFSGRRRVRKVFGHIPEVAEMPNLIEVQKASYDQFLMVEEPVGGRADEGLQAVFKSVFPISDFSGQSMLEFVKYEFEAPKFDVEECRQRDLTFAAPLKVTLRLIVFDIDEDTGSKSIKDIKEQDVYMGDMPLMTSNGTFIVNGTERVVVSQEGTVTVRQVDGRPIGTTEIPGPLTARLSELYLKLAAHRGEQVV